MRLYANYKNIKWLHETNNFTPFHTQFAEIEFYYEMGAIDYINFDWLDYKLIESVRTPWKMLKWTEYLVVIDLNEEALTTLWKTVEWMKLSLERIFQKHDIEFMSKLETIDWIKKFTNTNEIETNKFEMIKWFTDINWNNIEPVILDLN